MKVLYLKPYYFPEDLASSYLGTQTQEALIKQGMNIELFTPVPSRGIDKSLRKKYRKIRLEFKYNGKFIVHRFPLFPEGKNTLIRAFRYTLLCTKLFFIGCFNKSAKDSDVIMVSSTPPIIGISAALIKKFRHIPIIYNLQDIFPDSLVGTGLIKKSSLLWKVGRLIEDYTYRHADKIIVISEGFKQNILAKGVPESKIEVIYNWVDQDAVKHVDRKDNKLFDMYGLDRNKFYITYSGNIGLTQNMDLLLEVAKELETEQPNIHFVLIGEGAYKDKVKEMVEKNNSKNVSLLPFQPYEDISHVFSLGDAGLIISKPGVGQNSVPSKTWSIMSASRPVLANFDENELKSIIEDNCCGIFTKAGDKQAFKEAILNLYAHPELCKEYGQNARQFVLDNLTKEVGTQKYVDVIKSFEKK